MNNPKLPADLDPISTTCALPIRDEGEVYSLPFPACTLAEKVPGAKYPRVDENGTGCGVRQPHSEVTPKGLGTWVPRKIAIEMDLSNADASEHGVDPEDQIGSHRAARSRLWEPQGSGLRAR